MGSRVCRPFHPPTCNSLTLRGPSSTDLLSGLTVYLPSWLRNNWRTSQGEPVKNKDMVVHLLALLNRRGRSDDKAHVAAGMGGGVRFKHVRGHVGVQGNEEADVSEGLRRVLGNKERY